MGTPVADNRAIVYHAPSTVPSESFAFNGTWTDRPQEATAGSDASILINVTADDVYLVMGGTGTVDVSLDGRHLSTIEVGGVPRLYPLLTGTVLQSGTLTLVFSPGVAAYDFTFG